MNRRKIVGIVGLLFLVGLSIPTGVKTSHNLNSKNINLFSTPAIKQDKGTQGVKNNQKQQGESSDVKKSTQTNGLSNSKISFYSGESSNLVSTINFDVNNMKINVKNISKSFDNTNQEFLEVGLYSSTQKEMIKPTQINSGNTSELSELLNNKSFDYGDIISLTYSNNISIPVISNGNKVIGNIVGNTEYFKITKNGLERVNLCNSSNQKTDLTKVKINSSADITNYLKQETEVVNKSITSKNLVNSLTQNSSIKDASTVCAFINNIGLENIQSFYAESSNNANFIRWVLNNQDAMSLWLEGNTNGASMNALSVWKDIWSAYNNSHSGFNLKLSIAVALTNQTPIIDAFNGNSVGNPVQRYQIFESLNAEGGMYRNFSSFGVRLLKSVVDVPIENAQILNFRGMLLNNYNNLVNSVDLSSIKTIPNYSANQNPRIIGNVVNGPNGFENITQIASIACRVFGQPVNEVQNPKYGTQIYTDLYSNEDRESLETSNEYLWMANTLTSNSLKLDAINQAIQTQPLNIMAWNEKISLLKANKSITANDYLTLSNKIMNSLKSYPTVVINLLSEFNGNLKQVASVEQYNEFINNVQSFIENARATENILGLGLSQIDDNYLSEAGFVSNTAKSYGEIDINAWGQAKPVASMNFEKTDILDASGQHAFIATSATDGIDIKVYDSNMNFLNEMKVNGNEFGNEGFKNTLNNYDFNVGDIVKIQYNPGQYSNGYLTMVNEKLKSSKLSNDVVIQITENGIKTLSNYTVNGEKYSFSTGFVTTPQGQKYLVNGTAKVGLQVIDNKTYYFDNQGIMQTGIKTIGGQEYYFNNDGIMQTGWVTVNNNRIYFAELPYNFEMARNAIINALGKAQSMDLVAYTPESVDALSNAVNASENLIGNQGVTVQQMQKATADINNALQGLKPQKTPLKNAINKAESINLLKYTPTSVDNLSIIVNKGINLLDSSNYTLPQIDNTTNEILNGIKDLKMNNNNSKLAA
ncbi:MAG: N-acetylmuramoyl-L-alanine amidase family protein [Sarcina sp.]